MEGEAIAIEDLVTKLESALEKLDTLSTPVNTPTVGRIVYYMRFIPYPANPGNPMISPAIILQCQDAETMRCQLFVLNYNGTFFQSVPYSAERKTGFWSFNYEGDL